MDSISTRIRGVAAGAFALAALAGIWAVASRSGAMAARPVLHAQGGSLCTAGETPIFSCPLGAKRVSVCGSGKQAVYRYGTSAKVELTARNLTLAKRGLSGGGETQIAATNSDYTYILYDKTVRTSFGADGRNNPESKSGLLVRHGGRTLLSKECDDDAPIPARASAFIPAGGVVVAH